MTASASARVPFDNLAGFSPVFRQYCSDFSSVESFYAHAWNDPDALVSAAAGAAGYRRDRELLVEVLLEQNRRWNAGPKALQNVERLADPESVAVVTGQQVGLFTGPMYTVLKTLTAIQLAEEVERLTGRPCVPVFWLEGEDHDFKEASSIFLPGTGGLQTLALDTQVADGAQNTGPVGRLVLGDQISELIDRVESMIPPTEFAPTMIAALRETYTPEATLREAFAAFMRRLFPDQGLVFVSPDNTRLKELLVPLFRKELTDYQTSFGLLNDRTEEVAARFDPQVHPHPMNLFLLESEGRIRLDPDDDSERLALRGLDRFHTTGELIEMLEENPCRFSPNVVLRPISQDHLLPTVAYVAGPGEISYFAQLEPVYRWAGVPMPVIYPRASVSLVESRIRKAIDRLGVPVSEVGGDPDAVLRKKTVDQMDVDLNRLFERKSDGLRSELEEIRELAKTLDPSLVKSIEAATAAMEKQLDVMKSKLIRAAKRNNEQLIRSVEKVSEALFPDGRLQERTVSPLYFIGKHGMDLPEQLSKALSLETGQHQIVDI